MRLNREKFLSALESVGVGVLPKESVEQSNCIVFHEGELRTFNGEIACRCPSPLGKSVSGAVKAKSFLEQLRKWPDRDIDVEQGQGFIKVKGKRKLYKPRLEAGTDAAFDAVKSPKAWKSLPEEWAEGLPMCVSCTGTDEDKFNTVCVHVTPGWMESFDGLQLCRWTFATGITTNALIRASGLKHVATLGMTEVGETESWIHFRNPGKVELSLRRNLDENYQDLSEFLGALKGTALKFPKGLENAVDKAAIISVENGKSNDLVKVMLSANKIKVQSESASGSYSESRDLVGWKGEEREFFINPKIFTAILKRDHECRVGTDLIKIKGDNYTYLACLVRPEELANADEGVIEEIQETETGEE